MSHKVLIFTLLTWLLRFGLHNRVYAIAGLLSHGHLRAYSCTASHRYLLRALYLLREAVHRSGFKTSADLVQIAAVADLVLAGLN